MKLENRVALITGAGGEIGHGLVSRLGSAAAPLITLDVTPLDPALASRVTRVFGRDQVAGFQRVGRTGAQIA